MRMSRDSYHHRRAFAGFTLVEMIIVIGVILLLTALTVAVVTGMRSRAEITETENAMQLLESAIAEWEVGTGRQVTFGINGEPCVGVDERYEIAQVFGPGDPWGTSDSEAVNAALERTDALWAILSRNSTVREFIARVHPDHITEVEFDDVPSFRFLDAWGNPIIAVMPGRRYNGDCGDDAYCVGNMVAPCPDPDGTIRTPFENRFGVAVNRRIFFVSAGPSGRFGNLHLDRYLGDLDYDPEDFSRASDNIYSSDILIEEGRPQ